MNMVTRTVNAIKARNAHFLTKLPKRKIKRLGLKSAVFEVVKDSVACDKTKQAIRYLHYKKEPADSLQRQEKSDGSLSTGKLKTHRKPPRRATTGSRNSTAESPIPQSNSGIYDPSFDTKHQFLKEGGMPPAASLMVAQAPGQSMFLGALGLQPLHTTHALNASGLGELQALNSYQQFGTSFDSLQSSRGFSDDIFPTPLNPSLEQDLQNFVGGRSMQPTAGLSGVPRSFLGNQWPIMMTNSFTESPGMPRSFMEQPQVAPHQLLSTSAGGLMSDRMSNNPTDPQGSHTSNFGRPAASFDQISHPSFAGDGFAASIPRPLGYGGAFHITTTTNNISEMSSYLSDSLIQQSQQALLEMRHHQGQLPSHTGLVNSLSAGFTSQGQPIEEQQQQMAMLQNAGDDPESRRIVATYLAALHQPPR
jgi:hypothetical protein